MHWLRLSKQAKYVPLKSSAHQSHAEELDYGLRRTFWSETGSIPWICSTIFFAFVALGLYMFPKQLECTSTAQLEGTSAGLISEYETDFAPNSGPMVLLMFLTLIRSNMLAFRTRRLTRHGTIFYEARNVKMSGIDSEIDSVIDRYFLITEEEARDHWGDEYDQYWNYAAGGYRAGLDMFHTLHCVHEIRKWLFPRYYSIRMSEDQLLHQGHCIEQIRQYIMCAGDITPVPTKYFPGLGRNYVVSDVTHTCRDFQAIRDWVSERKHTVKPDFSRKQPPSSVQIDAEM
ncbi:hypothetical protein NA57DRAFT_60771 [Rhizodiscina lignyota]|uniref:Cyclochlorotine biosynthesis protein O n=1 Tax=Rhizodiscina lignyota TaxID=1504668 RepID=A0A9P4I319_9PEZI|nr:hypothetical protein NA57DRAFT_60771 [Rhizodiscina lignyota]